MDEKSIMSKSGLYSGPYTPAQKQILESLFGQYYDQAGSAVKYLKTPKGQKIIGMALVLLILIYATKKGESDG